METLHPLIQCVPLSSHRGEVSGSADGVLPASLHLRHHGDQRDPQVGHEHQETDGAQHHLVQLRLSVLLQAAKRPSTGCLPLWVFLSVPCACVDCYIRQHFTIIQLSLFFLMFLLSPKFLSVLR